MLKSCGVVGGGWWVVAWSNLVSAQGPLVLGLGLRVLGPGLDNFQAARPLGPDGKPIPGPAEVRQIQAARKMAQQQAQVDEVIGIMHQNVENVLERDRKLGDLEERADALQDGCAQFEKQAAAMKNKFWMENLKAIIAGSVVGLIVLGE